MNLDIPMKIKGSLNPHELFGLNSASPSMLQFSTDPTPVTPQGLRQSLSPPVEANQTGLVLSKGQKQSLSKLNPKLDFIHIALGWDLCSAGQAYDLDVEAFLLGENGKVLGDDWFVFYNQTKSPDGAVCLLEDNQSGIGDGDDETIQVQLSRLHSRVARIVFIVTINDAKKYGYNFSNVQNAYVRIVDCLTKQELIRFNLTDYYSNVCSMMLGEVYHKSGEWRFKAIGNGVQADLTELCIMYGVNVGD